MPVDTRTEANTRIDANGRKILRVPNPNCRATQSIPRYDLLKDLKEPLAVDIDFQEFKPKDAVKWGHRIGSVAVVNTLGETIYDVYVCYDYDENLETKTPPPRFGVTRKDLRMENGAKTIHEVRKDLNSIMYSRTIVGHGMRLDILAHVPELESEITFVDTQHIYGQIALSTLAASKLSKYIQDDMHTPDEDASATMELYLMRHPYQQRNSFKPAPFVFEQDNFPSLGAALSKSNGTNTTANSNDNNNNINNAALQEIDPNDQKISDDVVEGEDASTTATKTKGKKGKKKAWSKLEL